GKPDVADRLIGFGQELAAPQRDARQRRAEPHALLLAQQGQEAVEPRVRPFIAHSRISASRERRFRRVGAALSMTQLNAAPSPAAPRWAMERESGKLRRDLRRYRF